MGQLTHLLKLYDSTDILSFTYYSSDDIIKYIIFILFSILEYML